MAPVLDGQVWRIKPVGSPPCDGYSHHPCGIPSKDRGAAFLFQGFGFAFDENFVTLRCLYFCLALSIGLWPAESNAAIDARLLRHPDVSQTQIVFSYAEDLWIAPKAGGQAIRMTSAPGEETHPKFSADGQYVAFTAPYAQGNEDIYILPVSGGVPKRITHHPAFDRLIDWSPDGRSLIYTTDMTSERKRYNQLYRVSRNGGLPERLPMPYGEMAALSPDGGTIVYSYLNDFQNQPDFSRETWKRYRGGRAPDLWLYRFADKFSRRLTDDEAPDSAPMWNNYGLFFLSERAGGPSNLWALDPETGAAARLTNHEAHDVTRPSIGPSDIVYEYNGALRLFDLAVKTDREIDIELVVDQLALAPYRRSVGKDILSADLSRDAATAVFSARGEIVTIEEKTGLTMAHGSTSASAERYPSLSPDGRFVAFMSDATGEYQLHVRDIKSGGVRILTNFKDRFRYWPFWSPDGRRIAFIDSAQELYVIDVRSGRAEAIDKGFWRDHLGLEVFRVNWSPDGRWLAWSRGLENRNQAIFVYDAQNRRRFQLTSGYYSDANPVFDAGGNYLFMLSQRTLSPIYADIDFTWAYANSTTVALAPLRAGVRSPLDPAVERPGAQSHVEIDVEGFESRLENLRMPAGDYAALFDDDGRAVYLRRPSAGAEGGEAALGYFDFDSGSSETVLSGIDELLAVANGRALVRNDDSYHIVDLRPAQQLPAPLPTADIAVDYDRPAENAQIIRDAWRFQRDFFYDPGLHGAPWDELRDDYLAMAPYAVTDSDLSFLLREQAGELSAGHVWALAKPRESYQFDGTGLLGVDYRLSNGAYQIAKIYDAGPRRNEHRSPLAAPGVDVREGEYLLAVNGEALDVSKDPWAAFEGLGGKTVHLTIGPQPKLAGSRTVVVKTLKTEEKLRELAWVEDNRRKVDDATDGQCGYIFVPDTSRNGQNELMRQYRAQFRKKGLIIDGRFNSGGALGDRLLELLNRPPLVYFSVRNGQDYPLPELSHYGPKALITNGWSYSGGDGFPLLFKAAGVGPLIGTRTWGGLIGPAMSVSLVSGGRVAAPPQRVYTTGGEWAAPHGVVPDIEVENDPGLMMQGRDPQLERAIDFVLDHLGDYQQHKKPAFPSGEL